MTIVLLFDKNKKAESLYNRVLLLINRVKGYLNKVGRKLSSKRS